MIDWTKPIETVDGRKVNWVADLIEVGTVIYVYPVSPDNCGDAFIVNHEGFRVDDRAIYSKRQEPFIRNVKVKKEGWVNVSACGPRRIPSGIYDTEEEAKRNAVRLNYYITTRRFEWEE
jgi:hypothetical protein